MAEPDRDPVIQVFLAWVRRARVYAVLEPTGQERRAFVPIQKLETYFTERDRQRLIEILDAVFLPEDPPLYAENITPKYTAVFSILLHINKGRYIKDFTKYGTLSDARLPFDPDDPPPKFPISTEDPNFFSRFCDEQWKFCAPTFQRHMLDEQFEGKRILPITYKERLGGGGSGTLYKIKIHKHYNELILDESKAHQKLTEESASTFVLKTYITEEARKYYNNEVAAFRRLRPTPNIIEFYGSYIHGDSFNVLLEFADKGTLEQYFQEVPEPRTGKDVIKFWRSIFMLGQALTGIHLVEPRASTNGPPIFQGWHQDIKPENILLVSNDARSPYDWQFKLGDLGLSHFNSNVVSSREPTASDAHGTRTYGAPECYRADDWVEQNDITVKQNVDIWSLGCVYSEAARWVAGGYNGIKEYRLERKAETNLIRNFRDGDCFHNGEKALRAVHRSHKKTRESLGRQDHITERAIDIMIEEMLGPSAGRPSAMQAWLKSQRILVSAQEDLDQGGEISTRLRGETSPKHQQSPPLPPQLPPGKLRGTRQQFTHEDIRVGGMNEAGNEQQTRILDGEQSHSPESTSENCNDPFSSTLTKRDMREEATARLQKAHHSSDGKVSYGGTGGSFSDEDQVNQNLPNHHQSTSRPAPNRARGNSKSVSFDSYAERNSAPDLQTRAINIGLDRSTTGSLTRRSRDFDRGDCQATAFEIDETPNRHKSKDSSSSTSRPNVLDNGQGDWQNAQAALPMAPTDQPSTQASSAIQTDARHGQDVLQGSYSGISPHRSAIQLANQSAKHFPSAQSAQSAQFVNHISSANPPSTSDSERAKEGDAEESPYLSIEEALEWKRQVKSGVQTHIQDEELLDRLKKRDHIFLIDDSKSMKPYWDRVNVVVEALSYIVKDCDPDGTELYFTISSQYRKDRNTTGLLNMLHGKSLKGATDIDHRLNEILEKYKAKLDERSSWISSIRSIAKKEPKVVRPLNLYILTNGIWEDKSTGETTIVNFAQKLKKLGKIRNQVGIQFISFGNNLIGLERMRILDSELGRGRKKDEWLDIVDTTPSTGNVWKMLLGAINSTWDDDEDFTNDMDDMKRLSNTSASTAMTSPVSQHKIDES